MARIKRENKLFSLDTETIGLGGNIKRIALYDGETINYGYSFEDVEPFLDEAYKAGYMPRVYIHNLEFDIRKMPALFRPGNVNWNQTVIINNKYARIRCKHYYLHDSFKILPMALAKLSKEFDLEHGKIDLWDEVQRAYPGQYENALDFLNNCDKDDAVYLKYLGYDVMSLYELIEKFMDITGLNLDEMTARLSTASLSKYLFKKGYKGKQFRTPGKRLSDYEIMTQYKSWSSNKSFRGELTYLDIENKIREGYYGGRTEVFTPKLKKPGAFHMDVNSLYPAAMIDNDFPVGSPDYYDKPLLVESMWNMWKTARNGLGFIKAVVYIPMQHIPPLPVKMGKLVFPCGMVEGTWTLTELEYAVDNCGVEIREFKELIFFKQVFKVFKNFVGTFYEMKVEGKRTKNRPLTQLAKLILNTAYGWTVLKREGKTELKNLDKKEKYLERLNYENEEYGFINIDSIVVSDSIQAQVGAYVTSYARLILLDMLRKQDAKGDVYYCDTDSIVCAEPLPPEQVSNTDLGKWDCEGILQDGIFLFPKVYTEITEEETNIKFKGVSRDVQADLEFSFYENLLEKLKAGSKDEIIVEKGKEMLRSVVYMQQHGKDPNTLEYRDKKVKLGNVQKRNMDYENNSSKPWYFESLEEFHGFTFAQPIKKWSEHGNIFDPMSRPGVTL